MKNKTKTTNQQNNHEIFDDFFIVGIGASAGGLSAFESFFSGMPIESDMSMAFVLIQHLDPNHKSLLREIIQRYTKMQVYEIQDGMHIEKNCVYIIPPSFDVELSKGIFHLLKTSQTDGRHLPIDLFFHSLAKDKKNKAIGVVLSGTGRDGAEGIRSIKKAGGFALAQSIDSAQFDGMPRSAMQTGVIDEIVAPVEMPDILLRYIDGSLIQTNTADLAIDNEEVLKKIFILLHSQTSHDFSMYKPSTIGRRLERRLAVNKISNLEEYYQYLQRSKNEIDTLYDDLLIGVTSFFRDEEVFLSLEMSAIPKLFIGKAAGATVRIWVSACSSGEEAYSIAILIMEYMEKIKKSFSVQIFATDISARAIATARAGNYPLSVAANISQERLGKYFTKNPDGSGYKIAKNIRDMLIFSLHDIIQDPPFSNIDFISCRNLLIYLNVELQQKLLSLFHYALTPAGILLLGSSETLGELSGLYTDIDAKSKLFECKKGSDYSRMRMNHFIPIQKEHFSMQNINSVTKDVKPPLRELTENSILEQIAPDAILTNEYGDILYIHGRAGIYFELPSGETDTNNILKMAKEGLQKDLTLLFHKAKNKKQIVHRNGLKVNAYNNDKAINLTIYPVNYGSKEAKVPLYLVVLQENFYTFQGEFDKESSSSITISEENITNESMRIKSLKQELQLQKEFLQDANEKLETSNQELKSYNEEIQSMNEELQSTNEELETSKEELQSVNEELTTVNSELNAKVIELSRSNNDMNNLLSGTGIGTVFVDHELHIMRFTPAVTKIMNLIKGDIGRPVGHIVSNLVKYNSLVLDTQSVLDTLISKEITVKTIDEKYYLMRIQPYRTIENVIEGAVISFIDITEIHDIQEKLKKANELSRLAVVVRDSNDAVTVQDLHGNIIAWNPGAQKLYGWSESEALKLSVEETIPQELIKKDTNKIKELSSLNMLEVYETKRLKKDGSTLDVHIVASALMDENGKMYAIATTERKHNASKRNSI